MKNIYYVPFALEGGIIARLRPSKDGSSIFTETWDGKAWRKGGACIAEVSFMGRRLTAEEILVLKIVL